MIRVQLCNRQAEIEVPRRRLTAAVRRVLAEAAVGAAEVSLAVVDDPVIRALNREFLGHDYATDVLSFLLERPPATLEGEIVVSAQTAAARAPRYGWSAADELLLYVIHGALHLVGYDDHSAAERAEIRARERKHLEHWGIRMRQGKKSAAANELPSIRRSRKTRGLRPARCYYEKETRGLPPVGFSSGNKTDSLASRSEDT
jgi:probable rRNA maturation factor